MTPVPVSGGGGGAGGVREKAWKGLCEGERACLRWWRRASFFILFTRVPNARQELEAVKAREATEMVSASAGAPASAWQIKKMQLAAEEDEALVGELVAC